RVKGIKEQRRRDADLSLVLQVPLLGGDVAPGVEQSFDAVFDALTQRFCGCWIQLRVVGFGASRDDFSHVVEFAAVAIDFGCASRRRHVALAKARESDGYTGYAAIDGARRKGRDAGCFDRAVETLVPGDEAFVVAAVARAISV